MTSYGSTATSPTLTNKSKLRSKVELSVFFSTNDKNKEPIKENCDKIIESPSGTITLPIIGKDRFENEEVYLSLFSITGCNIVLTVSFPDLKIQNFNRRLIKDD